MDDWQETAFKSRHVHNRIGMKGRGKGTKGASTFDVVKTFGTYEVECPAVKKFSKDTEIDAHISKLEIYRLNEAKNALICELWLSNTLHGSVLLAGSRKTMNSVIENLNAQSELEDQDDQHSDRLDEKSDSEDLNTAVSEAGGQHDDARHNDRFKTFEKNSFRSPKFWLRWQGRILQNSPTDEEDDTSTGPGYLVFSGNGCNSFQGTINCEGLGWKDVRLNGRKTISRSARDNVVAWQKSMT